MLRKIEPNGRGPLMNITTNYLPLRDDLYGLKLFEYVVSFQAITCEGNNNEGRKVELGSDDKFYSFWSTVTACNIDETSITFDGCSRAWTFGEKLNIFSHTLEYNNMKIHIRIQRDSNTSSYYFSVENSSCLSAIACFFLNGSQGTTDRKRNALFVDNKVIYPNSNMDHPIVKIARTVHPTGVLYIPGIGVSHLQAIEKGIDVASISMTHGVFHSENMRLIDYAWSILKNMGVSESYYNWKHNKKMSNGVLHILNTVLQNLKVESRSNEKGVLMYDKRKDLLEDYYLTSDTFQFVELLEENAYDYLLDCGNRVYELYENMGYTIEYMFSPLVVVSIMGKQGLAPMEVLYTKMGFVTQTAQSIMALPKNMNLFSAEHCTEYRSLLMKTIEMNNHGFFKKILASNSFVMATARRLSDLNVFDVNESNVDLCAMREKIYLKAIAVGTPRIVFINLLLVYALHDMTLECMNVRLPERFTRVLTKQLHQYGAEVFDGLCKNYLTHGFNESNRKESDYETIPIDVLFNKLEIFLNKLKKEDITPVVLIFSRRFEPCYGRIKLLLDSKKIVSQFVDSSTLSYLELLDEDKYEAAIQSYVLRINSKMGGLNFYTSLPNELFTEFNAFQVTAVGLHSERVRNGWITTVVTYVDKRVSRFFHKCIFHNGKKPSMEVVHGIREGLKTFEINVGEYPKQVFIYRYVRFGDRHENTYYNDQEMINKLVMRKAVQRRTNYTYITVCSTRQLNFISRDNDNKFISHAIPGTVIDKDVVHSRIFEFLLVTKNGDQASSDSRPVSYVIFYDDGHRSMRTIQTYTNFLTFSSVIGATTRLPSVLDAARRISSKINTKLTFKTKSPSQAALGEVDFPPNFYL